MSKLHTEVKSIEEQVANMADLAGTMLQNGAKSLTELDGEVADSVISRREELAQMDEDIEAQILRTLALQEPVASDLRRIGTTLKLITYINRIGRYGYDIARVTRDWPEGKPHVARMVNIPAMAEKVAQMFNLTLAAFKENTVPDESLILTLEEDVDALRYSVWRECLTFMAEDTHNIERCAHYMMVARYLERCGDNICKMVEKQHWSATGDRFLFP